MPISYDFLSFQELPLDAVPLRSHQTSNSSDSYDTDITWMCAKNIWAAIKFGLDDSDNDGDDDDDD